MHEIFDISKKVQEAINRKKPIVALESTLISHGLPYPENIKVANESIKAVEDNGAIAATIGIIKGKVKIGLSEEDIQILAKEKNVQKVSNHNINLSIFNKVPLEKALNKNDVEKWINNATIKADRNNISGKELTPFLIKEINEQSKNETLNANVSLIINNANLAGKIAKSFYS